MARPLHPAAGSGPRLRLVRLGTSGAVGCAPDSASTSVGHVRCPACARLEDKVVDSRLADDGASIRRRRECLACGHRFTTFERSEEVALCVLKRSGQRVSFDRAKVERGVRAALTGRPVADTAIATLAADVEEAMRTLGGEVTSEQIGIAVLDRLRDLDQVASVRFASVYKDFDDPADFQREVRLLNQDPARRSR